MVGKIIYAMGRIASISSKPGILFFANNFLKDGASELIAIGILSSTLSLIMVAVGIERRFYKSTLSQNASSHGISFCVYLIGTLILIAVGFIIAFCIGYYATSIVIFGILCGIYFFSEKIADEVLRYYLFKKDFYLWGLDNIKKVLLQILFLFFIFIFDINEYYQSGILLISMTGANVLIFFKKIPKKWFIKTILPLKKLNNLTRRSIKSIYLDNTVWIVSVLSSLIGYADRILVTFMDKSVLPVFTIAVMCFSCTQMAVDFIFVSTNRVEFLRCEITLSKAISSPAFIKSLAVGILLSWLGILFVYGTLKGKELLSAYDLIIIFFIQLTLAFTMIPKEIIYWSSNIQSIIKVDGIFWVCLLISLVIIKSIFELDSVTIILFALLASMLFRLMSYLYVCGNNNLSHKF